MTDMQPMPPTTSGVPRDLFEIYMMTRAEISIGQSFYELYLKLLSLIDIGKEMLPPGMENLRYEAEQILMNETYYPETRQLESTNDGRYRVGPENASTGLVFVRQEDLLAAIDEVKNQQATKIIPRLKYIDSRIFKALIDCGIIEVKRPSMEELLAQDVMMSMQNKMQQREETQQKEEEKDG